MSMKMASVATWTFLVELREAYSWGCLGCLKGVCR